MATTKIQIQGQNADNGAITIHGQPEKARELMAALGITAPYFQGRREDVSISAGPLSYAGTACYGKSGKGLYMSISRKSISFFPNDAKFEAGKEYTLEITIGKAE